MSASLLLPVWLAMASPAVPGPTSHPAVHIWLNSDGQFVRGDHARVYLKTADDGYVVVLRADDQGRVRVLYPADPTGDDYVQATDKLEIHGRDNGKAFLVNDKSGGGLVVAAYSQQPFTFDDYVLNGHWDLTALTPAGAKRDPEAAVMNVVQTMSTGHPFEYDEADYVTRAAAGQGRTGSDSASVRGTTARGTRPRGTTAPGTTARTASPAPVLRIRRPGHHRTVRRARARRARVHGRFGGPRRTGRTGRARTAVGANRVSDPPPRLAGGVRFGGRPPSVLVSCRTEPLPDPGGDCRLPNRNTAIYRVKVL